MANRTLGELPLGSHVWIDEYVNGEKILTEYYLLEVGPISSVLLRKDCGRNRRMHSSDTANYADALTENGGTGAICEMDKYLCNPNGWMARYDEATQACLVARPIKWYDSNAIYGETPATIEITRRCFLLSYTELGYATSPDEGSSMLRALMTATGKTNANDARVSLGNGSVAYCWTRSAKSISEFYNVYPDGGAQGVKATNTNSNVWMRPALSVASETPVSPEDETTICLLPDPSKQYRELAGTANFGECAKRPKEMILNADINNLYDTSFALCNNAGDTSPTWVEATLGSRVVLQNSMKETDNWEIGMKFYGKSTGLGTLKRPIITVLTEDE